LEESKDTTATTATESTHPMRDSETGDSDGENAALTEHRDGLVGPGLRGASNRESDDANEDDVDEVARGGGDSPVGVSATVGRSQHTPEESNDEENHASQDTAGRPAKALPAPTPERPAPAVIVSGGAVEFSLDSIRPHLTCRLCSGLFREPYTLTKCLHTFCKSCLHLAFANSHYQCPTCELYLGQNLGKCALADRALQNLIDKVLFPEVARQDRLDEEEFYGRLGIERKRPDFGSPPRSARETPGSSKRRAEPPDLAAEEGGSKSASKRARRNRTPSARLSDGLPPSPPPHVSSTNDGDIVFRLIPHDDKSGADGGEAAADLDASELTGTGMISAGHALQPLANPYVKTSGRLRIGQLKKYLCQQLHLLGPGAGAAGMPPEADNAPDSASAADSFLELLEILCLNVPLGNELSVRFAQRAMWIAPTPAPGGDVDSGGGPKEEDEARQRDIVTFTYRLAKTSVPEG
jgi:Zinc finger, C3HC4 type (RING finger)